jgi:hypothetical protein
MPITGRKPQECFDRFRAHVAKLVAATLPGSHAVGYLQSERDPQRLTLQFSGFSIPVKTAAIGLVHLSLSQLLQVVVDKDARRRNRCRLETLRYWYRLQRASGPKQKAFIRWEYDRSASPSTKTHCRHHVQLDASVQSGEFRLDLNKVHLPTGWVTMEEVLRFLIVELGVVPPCGSEWPELLAGGEVAFYRDFTSKRYTP